MLDTIIDFLYDKMPGWLAILCFIPIAVIFLFLLMLVNIKRINRPINEWE